MRAHIINERKSVDIYKRVALAVLVATLGVLVPCQDSFAVLGFSPPGVLTDDGPWNSGDDDYPQVTTDGAGN